MQAPRLLDAPLNGKKDNLTRIKGIGVKIEGVLNEKGIYHFDQIAEWTEEQIRWVDENIAFPGRVAREQWVEQAKILAAGKETEFSKRVDAGEVSTSKKA
jgi:NADH-quinone oxidoreductase subunit E